MDQSEFSVAGATGNSNASVTAKSAVAFFRLSPSFFSCFSPCSLCTLGSHALATIKKGTIVSDMWRMVIQIQIQIPSSTRLPAKMQNAQEGTLSVTRRTDEFGY